MMLPLEDRAWAITRIAAEQHNITPFMSFHGSRDPEKTPALIQCFLTGEFDEEDLYNEACSFSETIENKFKAELEKRGF